MRATRLGQLVRRRSCDSLPVRARGPAPSGRPGRCRRRSRRRCSASSPLARAAGPVCGARPESWRRPWKPSDGDEAPGDQLAQAALDVRAQAPRAVDDLVEEEGAALPQQLEDLGGGARLGAAAASVGAAHARSAGSRSRGRRASDDGRRRAWRSRRRVLLAALRGVSRAQATSPARQSSSSQEER